jgi:hypothetical protein
LKENGTLLFSSQVICVIPTEAEFIPEGQPSENVDEFSITEKLHGGEI